MFDSASPCDPAPARQSSGPAIPGYVRGLSEVRAQFAMHGDTTSLARLYETGSLRLRMPRAHGRCAAVLLNTGGGIAGGDRLSTDIAAGPGAQVTVTSQAAEKIYRADCEPATIAVRLSLDAAARLDWLPQETILHDGAGMTRTLDVDMAPDATLTVLEIVVFGRLARGEQMTVGTLRDRWRIRRGGRLVVAEDVALSGAIADHLDRPAIGGGARAVATLLHVAPQAQARLDAVRAALSDAACLAGSSAWNGILIGRIAGADPAAVRAAAARAAIAATDAAQPRSWSC